MHSEFSEEMPPSIADERILSIPIKENHEPLVDLKNQSQILFGPSPEIPNNENYTKMRRSIYEKLLEAQKALPSHLKFCLYEAYRSLQLQEQLFNERYELLKKTYPHWEHSTLFYETIKLISPVMNLDGSKNIPPHSTGAAIDIYLIDLERNIIDMGIETKDWMTDTDGSLSKTNSFKISESAKQHREIMCHALESAGFVNYPLEYWHWSYGDRYWAYEKNQPYAIYDTVK